MKKHTVRLDFAIQKHEGIMFLWENILSFLRHGECTLWFYFIPADEELWSEADSSCSGQPIHLWQFLRELLLKPHNYGRCIRWLNKDKGIFSFALCIYT